VTSAAVSPRSRPHNQQVAGCGGSTHRTVQRLDRLGDLTRPRRSGWGGIVGWVMRVSSRHAPDRLQRRSSSCICPERHYPGTTIARRVIRFGMTRQEAQVPLPARTEERVRRYANMSTNGDAGAVADALDPYGYPRRRRRPVNTQLGTWVDLTGPLVVWRAIVDNRVTH
jgi:hypothetical protein